MSLTPTSRTKALMEERGGYVVRVEHWNAFAKVRQDLCGCDLLVLFNGEPPVLVQSTTFENRIKRRRKLEGLLSARRWLDSGGRILIHGWKRPKKRGQQWEVSEEEFR